VSIRGVVVGRELKGRHFLGLDPARTLPTPGLVATGWAVADLVDAGAMGVVHGAAGLGKTYAVETALAGHADALVCAGRISRRARPCAWWRRACSRP
jgi:hypothetical protein